MLHLECIRTRLWTITSGNPKHHLDVSRIALRVRRCSLRLGGTGLFSIRLRLAAPEYRTVLVLFRGRRGCGRLSGGSGRRRWFFGSSRWLGGFRAPWPCMAENRRSIGVLLRRFHGSCWFLRRSRTHSLPLSFSDPARGKESSPCNAREASPRAGSECVRNCVGFKRH